MENRRKNRGIHRCLPSTTINKACDNEIHLLLRLTPRRWCAHALWSLGTTACEWGCWVLAGMLAGMLAGNSPLPPTQPLPARRLPTAPGCPAQRTQTHSQTQSAKTRTMISHAGSTIASSRYLSWCAHPSEIGTVSQRDLSF